MSFTLAIVGRPNVGKSTLFNRLVGRKLALVDDQPGVTRDLREGQARLGPLRFTVIDSAGLEDATDDSLQGRMRRLTERAVEEADVCLFVIDARQGVTPTDEIFADILRKKNAHVILAANKAEGRAGESGYLEAFSLGLGEPLRLSAEHGEGMADLVEALLPYAPKDEEEPVRRRRGDRKDAEKEAVKKAGEDEIEGIGDQPELDHGGKRNPDGQGFGAFGKVVKGMEVVRAIQQGPAQGQRLTPAIRILRASRKG